MQHCKVTSLPRSTRLKVLLKRWQRNRDGSTAIEFGLVALPFLMMTIGIIGIGLYAFTNSVLEHAVESTSRQIRTGQLQTSAEGDPSATFDVFKQSVCDKAGSMIDCAKLTLHIQTSANWSGVTPADCLDGSGVQSGSSGNANDNIGDHTGGAGDVVLITVCYEWDLATKFDFINLGDMANGSTMVQAATTFRTEPYE